MSGICRLGWDVIEGFGSYLSSGLWKETMLVRISSSVSSFYRLVRSFYTATPPKEESVLKGRVDVAVEASLARGVDVAVEAFISTEHEPLNRECLKLIQKMERVVSRVFSDNGTSSFDTSSRDVSPDREERVSAEELLERLGGISALIETLPDFIDKKQTSFPAEGSL